MIQTIKAVFTKYISGRFGKLQQTFFKRLGKSRFCPVCACFSSQFEPFGIIPREDAQCPQCGSLERHRLVWLFFERQALLFLNPGKRMLHIAPEHCLQSRLRRKIGRGYLTADFYEQNVDMKMDITAIQFPNESFDAIYCSHVLEHVPNDKKAMREFRRVLKSDGWAIILVPITTDKTIEDPSITDPSERLRLFGQEDHVRRYGSDFLERLKEAGFQAQCINASNFLSQNEIRQMGITEAAGEIFFCK